MNQDLKNDIKATLIMLGTAPHDTRGNLLWTVSYNSREDPAQPLGINQALGEQLHLGLSGVMWAKQLK